MGLTWGGHAGRPIGRSAVTVTVLRVLRLLLGVPEVRACAALMVRQVRA